jgi:hypothetical protein
MARCTAVLLTCLAFAVPAVSEVYRFGPLSESLPAQDVAAIEALVVEHGIPWALLGWRSQVLPDIRYVDVFLQPTVSRSKLRRGRVLHLQCVPGAEQLACLQWTLAGAAGAYVQVAHGRAFTEGLGPRSPLERPIRTVGEFSDEEILTLVSYIRASPRPSTRRGVDMGRLDGSEPALDISREPDGSVRALLTRDSGVSQTARFVRTGRGWRITEVVIGVA